MTSVGDLVAVKDTSYLGRGNWFVAEVVELRGSNHYPYTVRGVAYREVEGAFAWVSSLVNSPDYKKHHSNRKVIKADWWNYLIGTDMPHLSIPELAVAKCNCESERWDELSLDLKLLQQQDKIERERRTGRRNATVNFPPIGRMFHRNSGRN
jgi:hypothetical protein